MIWSRPQPPSTNGIFRLLIEPVNFSIQSGPNRSRCVSDRKLGAFSTMLGRMPLRKKLPALFSAATAIPSVSRAWLIGDMPMRPSSEKPRMWKICFSVKSSRR